MSDFLPSRDSILVTYGIDFADKLVAQPAVYDVTPAEATGLQTLATNYQSAYQVASDPATRTPGTIAAKDTAKAILKASLRAFARRLQALATLSAQQRLDLGLPVRSAERSPVPVPGTRPILAIRSIASQAITVVIVDELTPMKRARPSGTIGAPVYSFVGDNPPDDVELWRFEGLATKAVFTLGYTGQDVNKPVHIRAGWMNTRGQVGPLSTVVTGSVAA